MTERPGTRIILAVDAGKILESRTITSPQISYLSPEQQRATTQRFYDRLSEERRELRERHPDAGLEEGIGISVEQFLRHNPEIIQDSRTQARKRAAR